MPSFKTQSAQVLDLPGIIQRTISKVLLSEVTRVNFADFEFALKVDVNEDPKKKGIKVQFLPTTYGKLTPTKQNDIAIELEKRLEQGLAEYDLKVERDRILKDKSIIGFFIYIEYFDKLIRKVLQGQNPQDTSTDLEDVPQDEPEV